MPTTPTTVRLKEQNRDDIDRIRYLEELNATVTSIDTEPTYPAEEVFAWMKTWGTDEEKTLEKSGLLSEFSNA